MKIMGVSLILAFDYFLIEKVDGGKVKTGFKTYGFLLHNLQKGGGIKGKNPLFLCFY